MTSSRSRESPSPDGAASKQTLFFPNDTALTKMTSSRSSSHNDTTISVMSYNLLAPLYVRPLDKRTGGIQPFAAFEWVHDDEILCWETRKKKLLLVLERAQADVICVQELQLDRTKDDSFVAPEWMRPLLVSGYGMQLPPQSELNVIAARNKRVLGSDSAVTCAVLYRSDRYQKMETDSDDTNTCVSVCLVRREEASKEQQPIVVSSVHLDAKDERKRVGQLTRCLKRARALVSACTHDRHDQPITMIIAGDMNQEFLPGSCVEAFLAESENIEATDEAIQQACAWSLRLEPNESPTEQQFKSWRELRDEANQVARVHCVSLARVETGCTRSAYDHGLTDHQKKTMCQWALDHLLYTTDTLYPLSAWLTLEKDAESCKIGLPNSRCPSDHIPVAAVFRVVPAPTLSEEERQALMTAIVQMGERHTQEIQEIEESFEREIRALQSALGYSAHAAGSKKGRPPSEMIDLIRKKRAAVKDVKARHLKERKAFVDLQNNTKRLAMQQELSKSADKWAETG